MGDNKLIILDNSIRNRVGHHFEYAKSVYDAAKKNGYDVEVVCHRKVEDSIKEQMNVLPAFSMTIYDWAVNFPSFPVLSKRLHTIVFAYRFFMEWIRSGVPEKMKPGTILFVPTFTDGCILALLFWMVFEARKKQIRLVLLFRYDPRFTVKWMAKVMRSYVKSKHLMLTSDSELLAKEYEKLTSLPYYVLPIPHLLQLPEQPMYQKENGNATRIVFLGDIRVEKGIDVLVNAIPFLEKELLNREIELAIQCNINLWSEEKQKILLELKTLAQKFNISISLKESSLSTAEYYSFLCSADVVVIPYKKSEYGARTSGILSEAIAAGKPVITTAGTWMALQIEHLGSGILFADGSPEDLAKAIKQSVINVKVLSSKALEAKQQWQAMHNAEKLLEVIEGYWGSNKVVL